MRNITFYISVLILLIACNSIEQETKHEDGVGRFTLNDSLFSFTYFNNNVGSVYLLNTKDSTYTQLTTPNFGWDLVFDISDDHSKVLYISYPNKDFRDCNICIYDIGNKEIDTLLKSGYIITEAILAKNDKEVYFLMGNEIKNYSPLVRAAPHGFDIYSLDIKTTKYTKLTKDTAYSIHHLRSISDSLVYANYFGKKGFNFVSTISGAHSNLLINSPRNKVSDMFNLISFNDNSILYEAPYEIYKYDKEKDSSTFLLRTPNGNHFGLIYENNDQIIFNTQNTKKLYSYNVLKDEVEEIIIKIKNNTNTNTIKP